MKNKFTSIFGMIAGLATMLAMNGIKIPVKGVDLVALTAGVATAATGLAAKDWRVTGGTVGQDNKANAASAGR